VQTIEVILREAEKRKQEQRKQKTERDIYIWNSQIDYCKK
jgi:hypothetical protein